MLNLSKTNLNFLPTFKSSAWFTNNNPQLNGTNFNHSAVESNGLVTHVLSAASQVVVASEEAAVVTLTPAKTSEDTPQK